MINGRISTARAGSLIPLRTRKILPEADSIIKRVFRNLTKKSLFSLDFSSRESPAKENLFIRCWKMTAAKKHRKTKAEKTKKARGNLSEKKNTGAESNTPKARHKTTTPRKLHTVLKIEENGNFNTVTCKKIKKTSLEQLQTG